MNKKWIKLTSEFLELASDDFSDHGCNDWEWPEDWSKQDRIELCIAMVSQNTKRKPREFTIEDSKEVDNLVNGNLGPPNWWIMTFLAQKLKEEL